jgi:hypothetical protein
VLAHEVGIPCGVADIASLFIRGKGLTFCIMAGRAIYRGKISVEFMVHQAEIGTSVVKERQGCQRWIKPLPLVIGMAVSTAGARGYPSMDAGSTVKLPGDSQMAVQTQDILCGLDRLMAPTALRFEICMRVKSLYIRPRAAFCAQTAGAEGYSTTKPDAKGENKNHDQAQYQTEWRKE